MVDFLLDPVNGTGPVAALEVSSTIEGPNNLCGAPCTAETTSRSLTYRATGSCSSRPGQTCGRTSVPWPRCWFAPGAGRPGQDWLIWADRGHLDIMMSLTSKFVPTGSPNVPAGLRVIWLGSFNADGLVSRWNDSGWSILEVEQRTAMRKFPGLCPCPRRTV